MSSRSKHHQWRLLEIELWPWVY